LDTKYVLVIEKEMVEPKNPMGQPILGTDGKPLPATEEFVVKRRDIQPGKLLDTQQRIVLSGLKPNETYVIKGVQRARIGSVVATVPLEEYNKRTH
jgi:multidrug efflux pump subunit AcrA (membrane-fusion protein)